MSSTSIWMSLRKYLIIHHTAEKYHFVKQTDRVYSKHNEFNKWPYFLLFSDNRDKIQSINKYINKKKSDFILLNL